MKMKLLSVLVLVLATVPAIAQTDIDGNRTTDELRITTDGQVYSDGRTSSMGTIQATHRYTDKFALRGIINGGSYFGEGFGGAGLGFLIQPSHTMYFEIVGIDNSHTDTYQAWEISLEGGTLVYKGEGGIKGVELDYNQTIRGFGITPYDTKAYTYTPRAIIYLPKNWDLMLRAGVVDLAHDGEHNPTPLGGIRLRIPVARRLEFTGSAGWGSEGLTNVQELVSLSTRNYGGGVKVWLTPTLSIEAIGTTSLHTVNNLSGTTYGVSLIKRW